MTRYSLTAWEMAAVTKALEESIGTTFADADQSARRAVALLAARFAAAESATINNTRRRPTDDQESENRSIAAGGER